MDNWDDLRLVAAIVEGGSITEGAMLLKIDQSTASRRLRSLERRLGRNLFFDTKKRNQLTPIGEAYAKAASRVDHELKRLDRDIRASDQSLEGSITLTAGDALSNRIVLSVAAEFLEAYPKLNLRISGEAPSSKFLDSDIAIFATNKPHQDYFGRKLATATFASYATPAYLEKFSKGAKSMAWLNWDDGSEKPVWPKLSPQIPDEMCRLRCSRIASLIDAAKMGLGATILPCFIGEPDLELSRVEPGKIVSNRDLWLFVQQDIRELPRIRVFLDHFYEKLDELRKFIEAE